MALKRDNHIMDPTNSILYIDLKILKAEIQTDTSTPVSIIELFAIDKRWKLPEGPLTVEWINKCGLYLEYSTTLQWK